MLPHIGARASHPPCPSGKGSAQPGSEEPLDVSAATRSLEAALDALSLDHHDRGQLADVKALSEVGVLIDVDVLQLERLVVTPPLQHLREIALDAS